MNIQESIKILECFNPADCGMRDLQAIETLLIAYEKEKEKNKELEQQYDKLSRHFIQNHISKDKIKARIEKYETMYNSLPKFPREHLHSKTEYKIVIGVLQELLEEEE